MKSPEYMLNGVPFDETSSLEVSLTGEEVASIQQRLHRSLTAVRKRKAAHRITALAACICCVLLVGQTSLAQQVVSKILQVIRLDSGIELYQTEEPDAPNSMQVPPSLQGKLYAEDGTPITVLTRDIQSIYTADGERIVDWELDGTIVTESQKKAKMAQYPQLHTIEEMKSYLCFTPYVPTYLPEGYKLDYIQLYQDKGDTNGEFAHLFYTNGEGKKLLIAEQFLTPENLFATGTSDTMKEVTIRGQKGVELAGDSLIWEENGISVEIIAGKSSLPTAELYKIADSLDLLS